MLLTATNHLIEVLLGSTVASTEWAFTSHYADHTTSAFTPIMQHGTTSGTTPVTIVSSPSASTQRQVKYISFYNGDTIANQITVRFDDGTNERIIVRIILQPGETLNYINGTGWRVTDTYGIRKEGTILSLPKPFVMQNAGFNASGITGTRTITSTNTIAQYLGRAEFPYNTCNLRYRVTTAAATITWAEVAIASGTFNLGGNQTLTTRGFTDISGAIASTGIKQTAISLSGVTTGMDLWALIGNNAVTAGVVRAGLADNLTTGFLSSAVDRPSTMAAGTTFTLGADTDAMLWLAATCT